MKILILNWRDIKHPLAGGAEVCIFEHAKYWKSKGAEVTWVTSSFENAKKEETLEGIKILRFGTQYTVHLHAFLQNITRRFASYDVIIDCFHFIPFFTPLYFGKSKKIAFIHEVAGKLWFKNLFFPFALIGYLLEPLFFLLYRTKPFITVSDSTKHDLVRLRVNKKNITIIPNGITVPKVEKEAKKEQVATIMFLGRISKDKGITDALDVYTILKSQIPDIQFWIAGREERKGLLESLISTKGIAKDEIQYFSFVSEEKKFELLKKVWILIHPSQKEGWGLTVIEAASQGTLTVGYAVEGLKDSIINNKTGMLTEKNPQAMAEAVIAIIKDKVRYNAVAEAAQQWAGEFSWEKSSKKSYEMITRLVENYE